VAPKFIYFTWPVYPWKKTFSGKNMREEKTKTEVYRNIPKQTKDVYAEVV